MNYFEEELSPFSEEDLSFLSIVCQRSILVVIITDSTVTSKTLIKGQTDDFIKRLISDIELELLKTERDNDIDLKIGFLNFGNFYRWELHTRDREKKYRNC